MSVIAENRANKKTTLTDNSDVFYPSQKAVKTAVDAKVDKTALLSTPSATPLDTNALSEKYIVNNLAKYTKMPNGATAVYSQDAWATADGWRTVELTFSSPSSGIGRFTYASNYFSYRSVSNCSGKTIIMRVRTDGIRKFQLGYGISGAAFFTDSSAISDWHIIKAQIPVTSDSTLWLQLVGATAGNYFEIDWIWIGDYSYLDNTLATEASRIANQLGDTTGVGTKASGRFTSVGTIAVGHSISVAGKTYTWRTAINGTSVEGDVLIGADNGLSWENARRAINRTNPAWDGVYFKCAAAHPLATAFDSGYLDITAINTGLLGNSITLATNATGIITISGSTLTGGTDDVGAKVITQLESSYKGTPKFNGVAFPATAVASSDPNTLDDYEEGTWTPTLIGSTTAGTQTYVNQIGRYVKVGRQVFIQGFVKISAKDVAIAGSIVVGGLPFASQNESAVLYASMIVGRYNGITLSAGKTQLSLTVYNNASVVYLFQNGSNTADDTIPVSQLGASAQVSISGSYIV